MDSERPEGDSMGAKWGVFAWQLRRVGLGMLGIPDSGTVVGNGDIGRDAKGMSRLTG